MGDASIIARLLANGHVQYGWSGNGGYFSIDVYTRQALADPTRREILNLLKNGRLSAGEICEHFSVTGASISVSYTHLYDPLHKSFPWLLLPSAETGRCEIPRLA